MSSQQLTDAPPADELDDLNFLTVGEVAGVMRVSKVTIYRMLHSGELTAVRVGRSFRVPAKAGARIPLGRVRQHGLTPQTPSPRPLLRVRGLRPPHRPRPVAAGRDHPTVHTHHYKEDNDWLITVIASATLSRTLARVLRRPDCGSDDGASAGR